MTQPSPRTPLAIAGFLRCRPSVGASRLLRARVCLPAFLATFWVSAAFAEGESYQTLWLRGDYVQARLAIEMETLGNLSDISSDLLRDRAELNFLTGQFDQAVSDLTELAGRRDSVGPLVRLAELYRYRGMLTEAQDVLEEAQWQSDYWFRRARRDDITAEPESLLYRGRLAEMRGDDAKDILTGVYRGLMELAPDYAPGFNAAGNLAASKGSYGTAAEYFARAIEIAPESQDALAGLALCYWHLGDERLNETIEKLETINPNHPRGAALRIEMFLDAGKTADAHRILDKALEINPVDLQFLALRAAALFLDGKSADMEAAQKKALEFNPLYSPVYGIPGRIASRHYRFREGSEFQRKALAINAEDHEARAQLGLDLLRLGEDEAGRQELEAAFKADPYRVQVFNSLKVLDTIAKFETVSQEPFLLQLPPDEKDILAEPALRLLQEASDSLQKKYALEMETPVRVQLFDSHDDFMVRSIGLPGNAGHLGICFGKLVTMDSPSARPKGSSDWQSVLWHEFTHVITLQKTKNRMPRWLSEGISVYEETQRNPAWGMRPDFKYVELIEESGIPGVSDLELYFTQPPTPDHLMLGYYLAGEFAAHYVQTYGHEALVAALECIGTGQNAIDSLASSGGTTVDAMNESFKTYLGDRFAFQEQIPAFAAAMRRGMDAQRGGDLGAAEAAYKEAHALIPDYVGPGNPLDALANLYETAGNLDAVRETLQTQLGLHTANWGAWQRLAAIFENNADWQALARVAQGAAAIDPFDVEMGRRLLRAQRELGAHADAVATAGRLIALDTPRMAEYKLARIEALMKLERWDEAKRDTVLLLEEMPSYWAAQEHLLALAERSGSFAAR